jgi:uncharacterized protein (DUF1501 family)
MKRSDFIRYSGLASTSLFVPNFLKAFAKQTIGDSPQKTLVVIQLSGGNDGLNTVIPYRNDIYYQSRPSLAVQRTNALSLNDELGLNPVMTGMKSLYDDGLMTVINSVGYPNPDRSHFRSMDIWQTASGSDQILTSGWIGRYLDAECADCGKSSHAIEADDTLSLAMKGNLLNGMAVQNPEMLFNNTRDPMIQMLSQKNSSGENDNLSYLYKTLVNTYSSADYIYEKSKIYKSSAQYGNDDFSKNLKTIAELIVSGIDTRVFYVSLGSFDTHVAQKDRQEKLLKQLSDGLQVFVSDLKNNNKLNDTLVFTFSEFGRRVKENDGNGTDHGTANVLFAISGGLQKAGVYNSAPDLSDLDTGDLIYKIDFRSIYATVLQKWLNTNPSPILGNDFDLQSFV